MKHLDINIFVSNSKKGTIRKLAEMSNHLIKHYCIEKAHCVSLHL